MQPRSDEDYWQQHTEELPAQDASGRASRKSHHSEALTWQASEAVHHEKNAIWFMAVAAATVVLLAISIFLVQSWTFAALVVVMAIAFVIIAVHPPRVVQYQLDSQGIKIDSKVFDMQDFRAFGVIKEGPLYSIVLTPSKRFMPNVRVYFPTENGEEIIDLFGSALPMESVEPDIIDKMTRLIRF